MSGGQAPDAFIFDRVQDEQPRRIAVLAGVLVGEMCTECSGSGAVGDVPCVPCGGTGWLGLNNAK